MNLFGGKSKSEQLAEQQEHVLQMEHELTSLKKELEDLNELFRHLDRDRQLLLRATQVMCVGKTASELGEALLELTFRPFGLASFYVAMVDTEKDLLSFPYFHEGCKARLYPPRPYSNNHGLTWKAINQGKPLYIRTADEALHMGAICTEAEKASGLIPQSWYGVPWTETPHVSGLVAFLSFQQNAFTESRRQMLDALSAIFVMALRAKA